MKNKKLNNCFRLKENKEKIPLTATCDSGLDCGLKKPVKRGLIEKLMIFKCVLLVI